MKVNVYMDGDKQVTEELDENDNVINRTVETVGQVVGIANRRGRTHEVIDNASTAVYRGR